MSQVDCRQRGVCLALAVALFSTAELFAQGTRPARPSGAIRSLESKAQEAQTAYLAQLGDLAKGYEEGGNMEQAQETLKTDPQGQAR